MTYAFVIQIAPVFALAFELELLLSDGLLSLGSVTLFTLAWYRDIVPDQRIFGYEIFLEILALEAERSISNISNTHI